MISLTFLRYIGVKSANLLESVGINTAEELFDVGVIEAYKRVKSAYPGEVTMNMLYALQSAWLDLPWNELPLDMKLKLNNEVDE